MKRIEPKMIPWKSGSTIEERLDYYTCYEPMSGCWLWMASVESHGYGQLKIGGRSMRTHRLSWIRFKGPIPDGLFVCHHCDTPSCINPDHLFLGTARDNILDSVRKGRWGRRKGEDSPHSVLNEKQVRTIFDDPRKMTTIAKEYGVSHTTVRLIKIGERWKYLSLVAS